VSSVTKWVLASKELTRAATHSVSIANSILDKMTVSSNPQSSKGVSASDDSKQDCGLDKDINSFDEIHTKIVVKSNEINKEVSNVEKFYNDRSFLQAGKDYRFYVNVIVEELNKLNKSLKYLRDLNQKDSNNKKKAKYIEDLMSYGDMLGFDEVISSYRERLNTAVAHLPDAVTKAAKEKIRDTSEQTDNEPQLQNSRVEKRNARVPGGQENQMRDSEPKAATNLVLESYVKTPSAGIAGNPEQQIVRRSQPLSSANGRNEAETNAVTKREPNHDHTRRRKNKSNIENANSQVGYEPRRSPRLLAAANGDNEVKTNEREHNHDRTPHRKNKSRLEDVPAQGESNTQGITEEPSHATPRSKAGTVYIGVRMEKGSIKKRTCFLPFLRESDVLDDNNIRVYVAGASNKITKKRPTLEIMCMYRILNRFKAWNTDQYAELRGARTSSTLDMIANDTMLYTTRGYNAIITITDEDIAETPEVKSEEVNVTAGVHGKRSIKRRVLYTDQCLYLYLFDELKIKNNEKKDLSEINEHTRLVLLCLLVYTGWGLYSDANETTSVSFVRKDKTITASVNQSGNAFEMFDKQTQFTINVEAIQDSKETGLQEGVQTHDKQKRDDGETPVRRSERTRTASKPFTPS
jgi:hypothetical protein